MFKLYEYRIDLVAEPFDNLKYRDRTVLIMCKDAEGKYLLGTNDIYPEGIVRLMGGGVNKEEGVLEAAIREIEEEMGIKVNTDELVELAEVKVTAKATDKEYKLSVFIYSLNSKKDHFLAGDDVDEIVRYSEAEFRELIRRFLALEKEFNAKEESIKFSPGDYGKVYGFIHQVVLDEVLSRGL